MDDAKTKWEQLQSRFKNSWLGIGVLALIAVTAFLTQVGDSTRKIVGWMSPAPAADLRPFAPSIDPLDKFSDKVTGAGPDTIYPFGATFTFNLVHNGSGDETITIDRVDVRVDGFDPGAACPFTSTGDRIFGHGEAPLKIFTVYLAGGKVTYVQRKDSRDAEMKRGHGSNLLELVGPLTVRKTGDDIEAIKVTVILDDAAQYKIGLSVRYTNRNGPRTATIPAATICKPGE